MNDQRLSALVRAFLFFALIGLTSAVQAENACSTCGGQSQYYQGRQTMAKHCCPECVQNNCCCCQDCMSSPAVNMTLGDGQPVAPVVPGAPRMAPGMAPRMNPRMVDPRMPQPRSFDSGQLATPTQPRQPMGLPTAPTVGQPGLAPMGQPPMGQPPMGQPAMGQPPMGQPAPAAGNFGSGMATAPSADMVGGSALSGSGASTGGGTGDVAGGSQGASAPNMIGDFHNGSTTNTSLSARLELAPDPYPIMPGSLTAADFVAGFTDPTVTGYATLLDSIPGVAEAGDSVRFDGADASPAITAYLVQTGDTEAAVMDAMATSGSVSANRPISDATFFSVAEQALIDNGVDITDELGELGEFVEINFLPSQSRIDFISDPFTGEALEYSTYYTYEATVALPSANPGEFIGRATFTDNNSPLPRDRVFFDFNYFHNARIGSAQIPMNRFMPGFEKTFGGGRWSFEARLPMAVTLSSELTIDDDEDILAYEIGDLAMSLKRVLFRDNNSVFSTGIGVSVPTADDFSANLDTGIPLLQIENRAVRLMPYLAGMLTPNERTFYQGFASVDVGAKGNNVFFDNAAFQDAANGLDVTTSALANIGTLQSADIFKLDLVAGRWLCRNRYHKRITDVAAVLEGHFVTGLDDPDLVESNGLAVGQLEQQTVFNATGGLHLHYGKNRVLTLGYGVPVTEDRFFDGEARVMFNRYF